MDAMLIGREKEKQVLQNALYEEYSQFTLREQQASFTNAKNRHPM